MTTKTPRAKPAPKPSPRRRGDDGNLVERAERDVARAVVLVGLQASGWKLRGAARALGFVGPSGIEQPASLLRKIRDLGLEAEYLAHQSASPDE